MKWLCLTWRLIELAMKRELNDLIPCQMFNFVNTGSTEQYLYLEFSHVEKNT